MSELRKDPVTGRWVIISTERRKRPSDFRLESVHIAPDPACPFCEGHEEMAPYELLAHRRSGTPPNGPGWELRQALGTAVFFGMIGVTAFGLIFTPMFYVATRSLGAYPTSMPKESYLASRRPLGVFGNGCPPAVGAPEVTGTRSGRSG